MSSLILRQFTLRLIAVAFAYMICGCSTSVQQTSATQMLHDSPDLQQNDGGDNLDNTSDNDQPPSPQESLSKSGTSNATTYTHPYPPNRSCGFFSPSTNAVEPTSNNEWIQKGTAIVNNDSCDSEYGRFVQSAIVLFGRDSLYAPGSSQTNFGLDLRASQSGTLTFRASVTVDGTISAIPNTIMGQHFTLSMLPEVFRSQAILDHLNSFVDAIPPDSAFDSSSVTAEMFAYIDNSPRQTIHLGEVSSVNSASIVSKPFSTTSEISVSAQVQQGDMIRVRTGVVTLPTADAMTISLWHITGQVNWFSIEWN